MSGKSQTDFTFNEAKEVATYHLSLLVNFIEKLQHQLPEYVSTEWIKSLQTIQEKVNKTTTTCLHIVDIAEIQGLAQQIIDFQPEISLQLSEFWYLFDDVFRSLRENPKAIPYAPQNKITKAKAEIDNADLLAEKVVKDLPGNTSTRASFMALLSTHINRTEKIEHSIRSQIDDAITRFNLQGYDTKFMCSVKNKVRNTNESDGWRTDVRAIRDSIAHSKYQIKGHTIEFCNTTHGYNFHKIFSAEEFYHFSDLHTSLYKFQLVLLIIIELLPVLASHVYERE